MSVSLQCRCLGRREIRKQTSALISGSITTINELKAVDLTNATLHTPQVGRFESSLLIA